MASLFQNLNADVFQPVANFFEGLIKKGEEALVADAQAALAELAAAENNAASALTAAQSKVAAYVNPIITQGVAALGTALEASVPGLTPLITAAEPAVDTAATGVTDTVIIALIGKLAAGLSSAAKTTAAINLSNLAGAVS